MAQVIDGELIPAATAKQLGRMLALYGVVGIVAGAAAAGFVKAVSLMGQASSLVLGRDPTAHVDVALTLMPTLEWQRLAILVVPALGGLGAGALCARFAPEALGAGIGGVIETFHQHRGRMRRRAPWVKAGASVLTLGSGGSAGMEGPIGFMVAGLGSWIARLLNLPTAERRRLLMAGFAAGIGAVFHAPMAASLFAAEVLYRELDLEYEVLLPGIISSTLAYAVFGTMHGWEPIWALPEIRFGSVVELVPYFGLAIAVSLGAAVFVQLERLVMRSLGRRESIPLWLRPAVGGLGVGVIGYFVPAATGIGHSIIDSAATLSVGAGVLIVVALAKMVTSALTAGSGGSGGLFTPSLTIGGAIGGAYAEAVNWLFPGTIGTPAAFVVVGMAAFFAAVVNAPISTIIMVSELTGSYELLVPALWVSGLAGFLLRKWSLYPQQPATRFDAPGHVGDMLGAILRKIRVGDMLERRADKVKMLRPDTPLSGLMSAAAAAHQSVFPIAEPGGKLLGIVDGPRLRAHVADIDPDTPLHAVDFLTPAPVVLPSHSLYDAFTKLEAARLEELVVVDEDRRMLGLLSRQEVIAAYFRRMQQGRHQETGRLSAVPQMDGPVTLADAVQRGGVLSAVPGTTPREIIGHILRSSPSLSDLDHDAVLEKILIREDLAPTVVGDGIAIPHPNARDIEGLEASTIIFATLPTPVPWAPETDDAASRVDLVVLILAVDQGAHLQLVAQVARKLRDPGFVRMLRRNAGTKAIVAELAEDDER